jgi:hypothetical protein
VSVLARQDVNAVPARGFMGGACVSQYAPVQLINVDIVSPYNGDGLGLRIPKRGSRSWERWVSFSRISNRLYNGHLM